MQKERLGGVERITHTVLAAVAYLIFIAMLGLVIAIAFLFAAQPSLAHDERQIRRDCRVDALKYCKEAIISLDRNTIIQCMVANRDRLSAACARHLW